MLRVEIDEATAPATIAREKSRLFIMSPASTDCVSGRYPASLADPLLFSFELRRYDQVACRGRSTSIEARSISIEGVSHRARRYPLRRRSAEDARRTA